MTGVPRCALTGRLAGLVAGLVLTAALAPGSAPAQTGPEFPRIPVWAMAGAFQDSTLIDSTRCVGSFHGPLADSLVARPRTITLRWLRDRRAEARPDFGGYRIYRVTNTPDSTFMTLVRRFSLNSGSGITWRMSRVNPRTLQFVCPAVFDSARNVIGGPVAFDSIATFVDPDSNANYVKVCRIVNQSGQCISRGDSVLVLIPPPGPHDGVRLWYSVTYERKNTISNDYEDLFVPDTLDAYARCSRPGDPTSCPNLNNKLANIIAEPVEPTGGPTPNLERVHVVPNPYRGREAWEAGGVPEVHFLNLPSHARISIYTVAGDLVRQLDHDDAVRDFTRWDLTNAQGRDVGSGIYMYRVEAGAFRFQSRFVVIR